eukprot:Selendium_serpulae@DN5682_c1_g1_i5.p1
MVVFFEAAHHHVLQPPHLRGMHQQDPRQAQHGRSFCLAVSRRFLSSLSLSVSIFLCLSLSLSLSLSVSVSPSVSRQSVVQEFVFCPSASSVHLSGLIPRLISPPPCLPVGPISVPCLSRSENDGGETDSPSTVC